MTVHGDMKYQRSGRKHLVPLNKGKGNRNACNNCRGISLLSMRKSSVKD